MLHNLLPSWTGSTVCGLIKPTGVFNMEELPINVS